MKPLTRAAAPTATSRLSYHSGSEAVLRPLLCRPNCYTVIDPMETLVTMKYKENAPITVSITINYPCLVCCSLPRKLWTKKLIHFVHCASPEVALLSTVRISRAVSIKLSTTCPASPPVRKYVIERRPRGRNFTPRLRKALPQRCFVNKLRNMQPALSSPWPPSF